MSQCEAWRWRGRKQKRREIGNIERKDGRMAQMKNEGEKVSVKEGRKNERKEGTK